MTAHKHIITSFIMRVFKTNEHDPIVPFISTLILTLLAVMYLINYCLK